MIWILYGAFLCTRIRKKFTCTLSKLALLFVGLLSLRVACIVKIMGQFLSGVVPSRMSTRLLGLSTGKQRNRNKAWVHLTMSEG